MNQYNLTNSNGVQYWYLDTKDRSTEILNHVLSYLNLLWHRTDGPAYIGEDGTQSWYLNGKLHREDGPAYIGADGAQEWYVNDNMHRLDGPACIYATGTQAWWVNNKRYCNNKSFQKAAGITDEEMTFMIMKYGNVK